MYIDIDRLSKTATACTSLLLSPIHSDLITLSDPSEPPHLRQERVIYPPTHMSQYVFSLSFVFF